MTALFICHRYADCPGVFRGDSWSWSEYQAEAGRTLVTSVFSSWIKIDDDVPMYLRDIKDEARGMGIRGKNKLTQYLNIKQVSVITMNSFSSVYLDSAMKG